MSATPPLPRLLLVEDDPISREFLSEALSALPAQVDAVGDIAAAGWLARERAFDLWMVDAHLPDGDGLACLRRLRASGNAPALAVTASDDRAELDALCAGGFLEVLGKPVSAALAQATVRRLLGLPVAGVREPAQGGKLPVWSEADALAAVGGNAASLATLRTMFLGELPGLRAQLRSARAAGDGAGIAAVLHKLKASCGFVGAARLARAVETLSRQPDDEQAWRGFEAGVEDALAGQS